jgi:hypothetical protein
MVEFKLVPFEETTEPSTDFKLVPFEESKPEKPTEFNLVPFTEKKNQKQLRLDSLALVKSLKLWLVKNQDSLVH